MYLFSSPEEDSDKVRDSDGADKQNNNENQIKEEKKISDEGEDMKDASMDNSMTESAVKYDVGDGDSDIVKCVEMATNLLSDWSSLKEVFRIPKKERIEQMKEHEREAGKSDHIYTV